MKIAIIGYSGCGKSTLARSLAERFGADVLHLDSVHFLPGWRERELSDEQRIVERFLDSHDAWIIDGNYSGLFYDRRMAEADLIVMLLFNRFSCLRRVYKHYRTYKGRTRSDMGEGCSEKLDREFVSWVLWKGRNQSKRERYKNIQRMYPDKVTVLKSQKQLDAFMR